MMEWLQLVIYGIVVVSILVFYGRWKLSTVPLAGPFPLPLVGNSYVFLGYLENIAEIFSKLAIQYGGQCCLWIGPERTFVFTNPDHYQSILTNPALLTHARFYDFFKPIMGDGLFTSNGAKWKASRRAYTPSFHPTVLRNYVAVIDERSKGLAKILEDKAGEPEFPVFSYILKCSLEIVFENVLDYKEATTKYNLLEKYPEPMNEILFARCVNPLLHSDFIFYLTKNGRFFNEGRKLCQNFLNEVIDAKQEDLKLDAANDDEGRRNSFLRQLFDRTSNRKEMIDDIITIVVTGSETASRVAGFALLMLGAHQDLQETVYKEDQAIQTKLNGRKLEFDDLKEYAYLEMFIKETMRIFPVGPLMGRYASADTMVGDYLVPRGTNIMMCSIATHRSPKLFPDPLKFDPNRFLPEEAEKRHPYSYLPFSSGPRNCIAGKLGMITVKLVLANLVRKFRIYSTQRAEEVKLKVEVTMTDKDGFMIQLKKRT